MSNVNFYFFSLKVLILSKFHGYNNRYTQYLYCIVFYFIRLWAFFDMITTVSVINLKQGQKARTGPA